MLDLKGRADFRQGQGDRYYACHICGPVEYRVVLHFDSGSTEPTVGETVTGSTSTNAGVVDSITLTSGTYAGGDAAGVVVLTSPTGYNRDTAVIFSDDETLNGSTSGTNFATVNGVHGVTFDGRVYPEWQTVEYEGRRYCADHFPWRFRREWQDEQDIKIDENERWK